MGGWFSSEDTIQKSKEEQVVNLQGNNNVVMLHEQHAQILTDIKITLISLTSLVILIIVFFVLKKLYKTHKKNVQRKKILKKEQMKKELSRELSREMINEIV